MSTSGISGATAIAGLGFSEVGRVYGKTAGQYAATAVVNALDDAGLSVSDVDGLITSHGVSRSGPSTQTALGLKDLNLNFELATAGATAGAAVQAACLAVHAGMAETVVYVHSDQPLEDPNASGGAVYGAARDKTGTQFVPTGFASMSNAIGIIGGNPSYALAARRHMEKYGTTSEQLGAIAVSQREWAVRNPLASMRTSITLEDHQRSRMIASPFHLLDCCLVSNGAIAVVITSADRARSLKQPPAYVWGWGQAHPGATRMRGGDLGLVSGAGQSGRAAFAMAGITKDHIDVREFYDCYTFTVLLTLEDYGFVPKGEGGPFAASGGLGPGGSLPTNTGGGQLSSFYLWGATPLSEAVIQARGQGGERQVDKHDFVLSSGNGGCFDFHSTLILGAHPRD